MFPPYTAVFTLTSSCRWLWREQTSSFRADFSHLGALSEIRLAPSPSYLHIVLTLFWWSPNSFIQRIHL